LPHVPFSIPAAVADARMIQPDLKAFRVCALTGEGIAEWCRYLDEARQEMQRQDHKGEEHAES
jgi:hydrogenase nickel incorporation protein HypB